VTAVPIKRLTRVLTASGDQDPAIAESLRGLRESDDKSVKVAFVPVSDLLRAYRIRLRHAHENRIGILGAEGFLTRLAELPHQEVGVFTTRTASFNAVIFLDSDLARVVAALAIPSDLSAAAANRT